MAFEDVGGGGPAPKSPPKTQTVQQEAAATAKKVAAFSAPTGGSTQEVTTTPTFPGIDAVLGSDPSYQQLLAMDTAMNNQDQSTMNARIAQMKQYYGSDTDPLSLLGRVYQSYQDRLRTVANTLAGQGMIASGETGWQGARANLAYQQNELDARMRLQQYIQGLQDAFTQAQQNRLLQQWNAGQTAVGNWLNNPTNQPQTVPTPVANPGYSTVTNQTTGEVGYVPDVNTIISMYQQLWGTPQPSA